MVAQVKYTQTLFPTNNLYTSIDYTSLHFTMYWRCCGLGKVLNAQLLKKTAQSIYVIGNNAPNTARSKSEVSRV